MPNAETPAAVSKVVRCESCGTSFRNVRWAEGTRCPRCRSPRFFPVPVVGVAVDYALADRSQGYALEDIRFAKIAQWAGLISAAHYQDAFNRQNEFVAAKATVPPIGEILLKMKALDKAAVAAILRYRCQERPGEDEAEFAGLARQSKFLSEEKAEECRMAQVEAAKLGQEPAPLPCLLYEKRYLQENQILALLQKQAAGDAGLIHQIRREIRENTVTAGERIFGPKGTPQRSLRITVAGVLAAAILILGIREAVVEPPKNVVTFCTACQVRGGMPFTTKWPAKCPDCGAKTPSVYPLAICIRCGHTVAVKDGELPGKCEKCGVRGKVKWFTHDINEERIKQGDQAPKQ